jgi:hypothetical protein
MKRIKFTEEQIAMPRLGAFILLMYLMGGIAGFIIHFVESHT